MKNISIMDLLQIIKEEIQNLFEDTFYHQTDKKSAKEILRNGFNTPEVWVAPDDTASYGDVNIIVNAPKPKKAFVMDYDTGMYDYDMSQEDIDKNVKYYESLGGEANPQTFNKLRELGYDVVIEDNGDRAFLYPKTLKYRMGGIVEEMGNMGGKKIYYHGRKMGGRPYSGKYIFITDSLGYASGYSDGNTLYTYTLPFSEDKLFSIKNPRHLANLRKYIDDYTISMIFNSSNGGEMDWAALSYIGTDDYETPEELFEHMGFYGIKLQERQGIDSFYVFDESRLNFEGEIDIKTPETINQIRNFYKDFAKDKNFLE